MSLSVLRRASTALARPLRSNIAAPPATVLMIKRMGGHHHFEIKPSTFVSRKLRDLWHLIGFCTVVFYGSIVFYTNVFIGPAQLAEIPEGYRPKHWEYYRHPISRFIQRYFFTDPQEEYEKVLNHLYNEYLRFCIKRLDAQVQELIKERKDYQAYYFRAVPADFIDYELDQVEMTDRMASTIDEEF